MGFLKKIKNIVVKIFFRQTRIGGHKFYPAPLPPSGILFLIFSAVAHKAGSGGTVGKSKNFFSPSPQNKSKKNTDT
jgi:hypothetical protein